MPTNSKVYVGSIGTLIVLDCGQDISGATARSILVRKPDGTEVTWAAVASGTDSIAYTSVADTFDKPGLWRLQAQVTLPSGSWPGETVLLEVYRKFQ
jgi:hypothetical protein